MKQQKAEERRKKKEEQEAKRKLDALHALKKEIQERFIKTGDVKEKVGQQALMEPNGSFIGKRVMCGIGGQFIHILLTIIGAAESVENGDEFFDKQRL